MDSALAFGGRFGVSRVNTISPLCGVDYAEATALMRQPADDQRVSADRPSAIKARSYLRG